MKYDTVIGLEVHCELKTETKCFCSCRNKFGDKPNTNCCPVCLGFPGALPVLNKKAVEYAVIAGLAFNCSINNESVFERKNYFYPDLSKAYQISQLEKPLCINGYVPITVNGVEKRIRLNRIHLEEDAGKLIHDGVSGTVVDYNRGGVPLIEIVTEPDITSADEAVAFLETLRNTIAYTGISDVKMEEGSLRCDVNLSVKPAGSEVLGTRTEMKNLNSFKAVHRAIEYEQKRQIEEIEDGHRIIQETLKWDDQLGESRSMRSKEDSQDYRYFPDPDLLPVYISDEQIKALKDSLPKLPRQLKQEYMSYGLSDYDASLLTESKSISDYFNLTLSYINQPKLVANYIINEVLRKLKEDNNNKIDAKNLAELLILIDKKEISSTAGKQVFEEMWNTGKTANQLVDSMGLRQVNNDDELKNYVLSAIEQFPQSVLDYKSGKTSAVGFL
ncbi:MAG TPA: Asp-tRNA(Asn)/Glu-tRNA(Gln) amidotransferase GatCAB subunit B, partial [Clostridiales bacterium]|nr:Asp-tRNA(Asn)/Glu-tRNA(Gln) amidotransferase GatCAB subunit B [Clostridiales bacterium]